jgi:lycopene beta-cyclase
MEKSTGLDFDYAFAGGGCAAQSLLYRMADQPDLCSARILWVEPDEKTGNDRTWCFWEKGEGPFESVVCKSWAMAEVGKKEGRLNLSLGPYRYKMIRSADFYREVRKKETAFTRLVREKVPVKNIHNEGPDGTVVELNDGRNFRVGTVFDSRMPGLEKREGEFYLLQHFKGWFIRTHEPEFDPDRAVLMDFSVDQHKETRFVYVLPFSSTEALVEFTVFSPRLLQHSEYDRELEDYLRRCLKGAYTLTETEFGVIPMYSVRFPTRRPGIYYIGTAGGQTKASTGYTFTRIQRHSDAIVRELTGKSSGGIVSGPAFRHRYFDRVLLHVLARRRAAGDRIFFGLFRRNGAAAVFRFLDEDGTLWQDYRLINTVPILRFIVPGIVELWRMLKGR